LDTDIQKFENERKDWIEKKGKIQDKAAKNHSKITEFKNNALKKTNLERILDQYTDSLKELDNDSTCSSGGLESFAEAIEKSKERKENENQKFESLKQKSDDYEMCKFILGEEGIKSFIIKRLLEMLNSSVQKYITSLGMTMRCKFDEYFDEKITNAKGKDISYWNFSGGERRTVDLACAWAFKDIKRKIAGVSSNVELYDEIMDGAFDERGLDLLIEVLKERIEKNKISCYTISHRKETLKHIDAEIVNLEKENDITRRINF
jgi:DNA repair exonuclease SbcCD ATPase subunit